MIFTSSRFGFPPGIELGVRNIILSMKIRKSDSSIRHAERKYSHRSTKREGRGENESLGKRRVNVGTRTQEYLVGAFGDIKREIEAKELSASIKRRMGRTLGEVVLHIVHCGVHQPVRAGALEDG